MEWTALSPDLNPIEHFWDYLDRQVAALNPPPRSSDELEKRLLRVWFSLPISVSDNLIDSMESQFCQCIQFNTNFTCRDPTIMPYELIHSRNRGTVGHNMRLHRAWQVLDVYASRLITLKPPEYGAPWETLLSVHLFHPTINL
ncbi:hypothetical protein AVEN_12216-1 [Araneus ventricosus]|uniref:Tc1-like transposase DDE domain-containing protein n=1 Tax=Araneus ventricosus TaxID=182803 RepID=A0A4Y2HYJ0_ARAVE|nr:hypothetical protein AVEN_12216-1 [Araneus ventricosus]